MYQQGYPEGSASGQTPRRRTRSRTQTETTPPAAPAQQGGYSHAASSMGHQAEQPGAYGNGYANYAGGGAYQAPAQNGYYQQPQYPYQDQQGYYQQGYYAQQQPELQQSYAQQAYPQQQAEPQQSYYAPQQPEPQQAYAQQPYPQQQAEPQQNYAQQAYSQQPYQGQMSYGAGYHPPQPQPPAKPRKPAKSPKTAKGAKNTASSGAAFNLRNYLILGITLAAIAGIFLLVTGANSNQGGGPTPGGNTPGTVAVSRDSADYYATRFLPNVYVDGICLAEMTFQEGSDAVWAQARDKQSGWYVRLKNENGSYKDITADMLGISFDPTNALQQAWAIGHTPDANGQVPEKALMEAIAVASTTEYHFTSAQQSANTSPIDTILNTLQTNAYRAPQDAVILSFNPDDFVNPFTFQQEVWGQWLDVDAVKGQILQMVSTLESGEILLQITPIAPNVTVADLQKTVTLRCRAVTPISSSSTEDRTNNIRVAFSKINGKSIAHGDKFSFNKFVGRRSMENGFFQAIEYAYGEEVMGVGGGVCQASTTVYLAAIQSGMTITDREAHSNPVNYTSLGMDATVSDTRGREVDFTFRNESGGRIFIAAHVVESGSNRRSLLCEVRIYGPALDDVHYKLESETVEVIPKPEEPKLKEDETGEHAFYVDEQKLATKGREGYVVDTFLCTYQGDTLISRDKVSRDTYPARQDVYWVGTNPR